ncbi:hypothetical protein SLS60_011671 [Paraconiothyrium brasiliense]|uniref:Uncharacterized protein n=1 Tax=Paraconiothyrium brasiliense TaxID=300254 RepID=A0ABR3QI15_9PLEO
MASKHNIYLATCTRPRSCLLVICDNPSPFTAAAYYSNGVSTSINPTELATITNPASPWEGTPRQGRFRTGTVTSTINAGAKALPKGEIAGEAKLGIEEFVCFRDGVTKFTATGWDDLELQTANCVQCPQDMCRHFNGTFNAAGTCTVDLSASELCGVLKGKFGNDQCYINLKDTAGGGGSEDDKKDACAKLKGTWDGTKCEVLRYTG